MKGMVHALHDLGEPVGDRTLVVNILQATEQEVQPPEDLFKAEEAFPLLPQCPQQLAA
jgi:hypothetical protein